ncbi:MAG: hypothetical protein AAGH45_10795 [Pseudomonadota bacterium]
MKDILLYLSGGLGMAIALVHGYLGETKVVRPTAASTPAAKRVLHAIMFLSGVYWFVASAILVATPAYVPELVRPIVVYGVAAIFISGCVANFWATRGRHFGWALLALAAGLALAGV